MSDHYALHCMLSCSHPHKDNKLVYHRQLHKINKDTLIADLEDISLVLNETDVKKWLDFTPVTLPEIKTILSQMDITTFPLDPFPTSVLIDSDVWLDWLVHIVNMFLSTGIYPEPLKTAIVKPLLKIPTLDCTSFRNFRPVSNIAFMSKVIIIMFIIYSKKRKTAVTHTHTHNTEINYLYTSTRLLSYTNTFTQEKKT